MIRSISFVFLLTVLWLAGFGQPQPLMRVDTSRASVEYWQKWMNDLGEMGVEKRNDSFFVREEVMRLMKDSAYRKTVYPEKYDWPAVVQFLQQMELKKAFWHLLNLYQADTAHRNIVVGSFLAYDSVMDMHQVLLNTYYTYAFTDPACCRVVQHKIVIDRPDILERKLAITREIAAFIWDYRQQRNRGNPRQ